MMSAGSPSTPASSANIVVDVAKCPTVIDLPLPDEGYQTVATTFSRISLVVPAPYGPDFKPLHIGGPTGSKRGGRKAMMNITRIIDRILIQLVLPAALDRIR